MFDSRFPRNLFPTLGRHSLSSRLAALPPKLTGSCALALVRPLDIFLELASSNSRYLDRGANDVSGALLAFLGPFSINLLPACSAHICRHRESEGNDLP